MPDLLQRHTCILVHAHNNQDETQRQLPCHPVSNIDRQWVKKRLDAVRHPFNSRGVENIRMMMNSVCTVSTVLTCVCGQEKYSPLGFLQQHIKWNHRSRTVQELYLQSLQKSLIYDFKDRKWSHFHVQQQIILWLWFKKYFQSLDNMHIYFLAERPELCMRNTIWSYSQKTISSA